MRFCSRRLNEREQVASYRHMDQLEPKRNCTYYHLPIYFILLASGIRRDSYKLV